VPPVGFEKILVPTGKGVKENFWGATEKRGSKLTGVASKEKKKNAPTSSTDPANKRHSFSSTSRWKREKEGRGSSTKGERRDEWEDREPTSKNAKALLQGKKKNKRTSIFFVLKGGACVGRGKKEEFEIDAERVCHAVSRRLYSILL